MNSPPPATSSSLSSSSSPLATKSAPPHPGKKKNNFSGDVNHVIWRSPVPRKVVHNRKSKKANNQSQTQLDAHATTIPSLVHDAQMLSKTVETVTYKPEVPISGEDEQNLGEDDEFDLQYLEQKAEEELYERPKKGETYEAVNVELIEKRLKHLSNKVGKLEQTPDPDLVTMIDEGLEIADSVSLLKIKGTFSSKVVEMAGQKAQKAATLIIQSQIMLKKARELLAQSKDILQDAEF